MLPLHRTCCSDTHIILLSLFLLLIYFPSSSLSISSIPFSPSCSSNQFFDPVLMQCNNCTTIGTTPSINMCACANGYIDNPINQCQSCTTGVSSRNRKICMGCDPTTTLGISNGECICPPNFRIVETDSTGNYLTNKTCISCGTTSYRSPSNAYECIVCPDPLMTVVSGVCDCDNVIYSKVLL